MNMAYLEMAAYYVLALRVVLRTRLIVDESNPQVGFSSPQGSIFNTGGEK